MLKILQMVCVISVLSFSAYLHAEFPSVPQKYLDRELKFPLALEQKFPSVWIESREFVGAKARERAACRRQQLNFALYANDLDSMEAFLETPLGSVVQDLQQMDNQHLWQAEVINQPWSGDYWSYSRGILATRYRDPEFRDQENWLDRYEYVRSHPAQKQIETGGQPAVDRLSPAEKYDLLLGDAVWNFSISNWNQGKEYQDAYGKVESWMGICHGWAPAAIFEPRPIRSIHIPAGRGDWQVSLNPSEIKGLVSYSWATNFYQSVTLGQRCHEKDPARDENGHILDPSCSDLNPATWHIAIVNKIGINRKSFVMDATYDYEVWNQPVAEYSYRYFNPQTSKPARSLQEASVSRNLWKNDRFNQYRHPETETVVGIAMRVKYIAESTADQEANDSTERDIIRWVEYVYDLELDKSGQLIGGEWHSEGHPDFVWTPRQNAQPFSPLDPYLKRIRWEAERLPVEWMRVGQVASKDGRILNSITKGLLKRSAR